ncbi:hypothetical protein [Atopomonas hussainii]|uniref:hypothetical protein n=1 Tax=Atopomonas hussainii TaxID=1429083 RepID=UPI0009002335|nr:hypothetical protein [Atopomonas hussainii]
MINREKALVSYRVEVHLSSLLGNVLDKLSLEVDVEVLPARELIGRYVLESLQKKILCPSLDGEDQEVIFGCDLLEVEQHKARAYQAFQSKSYLLLIDDRQVETLDELCHLSSVSVVKFLRMVPIVGA